MDDGRIGARPHELLSLVVGSGAWLIAIGLAAGLIGAVITTQFLRGLVAWVDPLDPRAFGAATAFLTVVALTACYVPARRAASVDPIVALRREQKRATCYGATCYVHMARAGSTST